MAISKERLEAMKAKLNGCPLMAGRDKLSWDDLENSDITISEYYDMSNGNDHFYCVTFNEYPTNYAFTGKQLTELIDEFGDDVTLVTLTVGKKTRTKNNNTFVPFTIK